MNNTENIKIIPSTVLNNVISILVTLLWILPACIISGNFAFLYFFWGWDVGTSLSREGWQVFDFVIASFFLLLPTFIIHKIFFSHLLAKYKIKINPFYFALEVVIVFALLLFTQESNIFLELNRKIYLILENWR